MEEPINLTVDFVTNSGTPAQTGDVISVVLITLLLTISVLTGLYLFRQHKVMSGILNVSVAQHKKPISSIFSNKFIVGSILFMIAVVFMVFALIVGNSKAMADSSGSAVSPNTITVHADVDSWNEGNIQCSVFSKKI